MYREQITSWNNMIKTTEEHRDCNIQTIVREKKSESKSIF